MSDFVSSQMFASGGKDDKIRIIHSNGTINKCKSLGTDIISLDAIDGVVVAGTNSKDVYVWFYNNDSLIQHLNSQSSAYSVLILNETHFLAGYEDKIILWSFDLINQKIVTNQTFDQIMSLKLIENDYVLMSSSNGKIFVYSIKDEKISSLYDFQINQFHSIDVYNRNFIMSNYLNRLHIFGLHANNSIYLRTQIFSNELGNNEDNKVSVIKIVNECFVLLGGCRLLSWSPISNFSIHLNQGSCGDDRIIAMDILSSDKLITGHKSGSIRIDRDNLQPIFVSDIYEEIMAIKSINKIQFNISCSQTISNDEQLTTKSLTTHYELTTSKIVIKESELNTAQDETTTIASSTNTFSHLFSDTKSYFNSPYNFESSSSRESTYRSLTTSSAVKENLTDTEVVELTTNPQRSFDTNFEKKSTETYQTTNKPSNYLQLTEQFSMIENSQTEKMDHSPIHTKSSVENFETTLFDASLLKNSLLGNLTVKFNSILSGEFILESIDVGLIMDLSTLKLDMTDCLTNCSGNGRCKVTDTLKFECECFENYAGSKCHVNTLACFSNPCRNNATCIENISHKSYSCQCYSHDNKTSLFYGSNCENKVDVCKNESCSKNGVCFDDGFEPKCKCFDKYSGDKCQIESQEIKVIKAIISTSSIIAICILVILFIIIIFCDLASFLCKKKKRKNFYIKTQVIKKLKYYS